MLEVYLYTSHNSPLHCQRWQQIHKIYLNSYILSDSSISRETRRQEEVNNVLTSSNTFSFLG